MAAHPSYPNPQLVEALCEIHLRLSPIDPWKPNMPGAFFKVAQESYPEIEPVTQQGIQLVIGPGSLPQQQLLQPRLSFRLKHRERPMIIQVSEQIFALNTLRPYPGWDGFKSELRKVWPWVMEVIKPQQITRIGMRYINRIPRRAAEETPGYWLKSCEYVPAAFLESGPGYQLRLQNRIDGNDRLVLTIAHDQSDSKEMHGSMLLDIDRITEHSLETCWTALEAGVEILHEEIWRIFGAVKSDRLEQLIQGKSQ